jgi:hypothetical protein
MVRHRGAAPASDSLFVAVIEPFASAPAVASIERLPLAAKDLDHVALRIRLKSGREDVVLVDLANPVVTGQPSPGRFATADGKFALTGRVGVATKGAGAARAALVAGTRFEHEGAVLTSERPAYTGSITGVLSTSGACSASNAFITSAELPAGEALKGRWMILTMGTYKVVPSGTTFPLGIQEQKGIRQPFLIDHVERRGAESVVFLADDPMLVMAGGKVTETTRPERTFEGPVSFEVTTARGE